MKRAWASIGVLGCVALTSTADAAPKKKSVSVAVAAPAGVAEFDRQAASTALADVTLQRCKATNATAGDGHVTITFSPGGTVQEVKIDKGPWIGTPVGRCMLKEFRKAKVPAFRGGAVTVGKSFHFA